ncbi:aspartyl/asparaginyl beta-hydroxylase domain-containing protein [Sphingomonas flavalba]|uniref:aspartyl/asparaginyl beta-hydroxylase domain-containing protein n=1 Tax=Sphingomonas flavalba TaxID=2559804 RepID=UPI0039E04BCE
MTQASSGAAGQSAAELILAADRSAERGDIRGARALLERATAENGAPPDSWLKLAAMCKAGGDDAAAERAVDGALRSDPLHFVALLFKASLMERAGNPRAGEAYGNALAQRPAGALPAQMSATVAHAEAVHRAHIAEADKRFGVAMAPFEKRASADEARRMARFRSNALRLTRPYHSEPTHFHYPGLVEREFHDRAGFPWLLALEHACDAILAEFHAVMAAEHALLEPYIQYPAEVPLRQWKALNRSRNWTAIHLWKDGRRVEENARHCPRTMAVLEQIPQPRAAGCSPNAMFSLLAPRTTIPPHVGVNNTRLVCHLPLIVPDHCWFRVGAETRSWTPGEAFVFDDTIEHEAANGSEALRVVFIIDVWHPDLSPVERDAVSAMLAAGQGGPNAGL